MRSAILLVASIAIAMGVGCSGPVLPYQPDSIDPETAQQLRRLAADEVILNQRVEQYQARQALGLGSDQYAHTRDRLKQHRLEANLDFEMINEEVADSYRWADTTGALHGFFAPLTTGLRYFTEVSTGELAMYNFPNTGFSYDLYFLAGVAVSIGIPSYWAAFGFGNLIGSLVRRLRGNTSSEQNN